MPLVKWYRKSLEDVDTSTFVRTRCLGVCTHVVHHMSTAPLHRMHLKQREPLKGNIGPANSRINRSLVVSAPEAALERM